MTAIETRGLTKRFGEDVVAVDSLDLTVESGEIFGFLGPNGAGKSTTINVLLDFIRPTEGSAEVLGYDAQRETQAIRRRVGVLPEGATLYDRLTGREHVEWVARTKGADADPDAILDRVGLGRDDRQRRTGGYSKGMSQRLALGMALVGDPDLLILDEPSSGLDPNGIQEMRDLLREEAERGTTVFFSSHILPQVEAVCDRVGIMSDGRLVAEDTIAGLREATGGSSEITATVDALPEGFDPATLADLAGVERASADGNDVTAVCSDPGAKMEVLKRIDEVATVRDVHSEEASLEDLFNRYTAADPGDGTGRTESEASGTDGEPEVEDASGVTA
ncbi:ABC transporter ATP-binding protein [Halorussus gelatinilyticus]|uniref:ABC transporter ATP-binding protein n=1 Tax=Halorussus gelatinilyticus TaxID=2937524 RepID=A0A8U0IEE6_9EURY|nr:ABC transporter ATP-binding protein [Halorussus gelatinilyticus]UPV99439.1 ABC transporter ATP-binding protein [Halorussus gelatinilyticus]